MALTTCLISLKHKSVFKESSRDFHTAVNGSAAIKGETRQVSARVVNWLTVSPAQIVAVKRTARSCQNLPRRRDDRAKTGLMPRLRALLCDRRAPPECRRVTWCSAASDCAAASASRAECQTEPFAASISKFISINSKFWNAGRFVLNQGFEKIGTQLVLKMWQCQLSQEWINSVWWHTCRKRVALMLTEN